MNPFNSFGIATSKYRARNVATTVNIPKIR